MTATQCRMMVRTHGLWLSPALVTSVMWTGLVPTRSFHRPHEQSQQDTVASCFHSVMSRSFNQNWEVFFMTWYPLSITAKKTYLIFDFWSVFRLSAQVRAVAPLARKKKERINLTQPWDTPHRWARLISSVGVSLGIWHKKLLCLAFTRWICMFAFLILTFASNSC